MCLKLRISGIIIHFFILKGGEFMEAFNSVILLIQGGISAYGLWMLITGLVTFGSGFSNHQSTEMKEGGGKIIGGAVIISGAVLAGKIPGMF